MNQPPLSNTAEHFSRDARVERALSFMYRIEEYASTALAVVYAVNEGVDVVKHADPTKQVLHIGAFALTLAVAKLAEHSATECQIMANVDEAKAEQLRSAPIPTEPVS